MNKYNVVSIFSGGGGLDLGFINAGFDILYAIDNEKNAVNTYKYNIGNHIICEDINRINVNDLPKCDIVIGGPPCQSFSLAGNRKTDDLRGKLVWRYIEIIRHLKPMAFVFENVTGLLSAKNCDGEKIFPLLENQFREMGYTISSNVVNAVDFGIPQRRKRVIIVGLMGEKKFAFPNPTHGELSMDKTPYVSVFEALSDLPKATDENADLKYPELPLTEYQREMRYCNELVTEHFISKLSQLDKYIISHVQPGGNYMDIPTNVASVRIQRLQKTGGHTTCYGRLNPSEPSYTVNTYFNRPNVGCNIHYSDDRLITTREALRLQSFPDKYRIISTSKQGKNLIVGNAVPPKLAQIIATALKEQL